MRPMMGCTGRHECRRLAQPAAGGCHGRWVAIQMGLSTHRDGPWLPYPGPGFLFGLVPGGMSSFIEETAWKGLRQNTESKRSNINVSDLNPVHHFTCVISYLLTPRKLPFRMTRVPTTSRIRVFHSNHSFRLTC